MLDHNPKHQSEMILERQLKPFLYDLAGKYQGKTVYIYQDSHLEHTSGNADPVTLKSLTLVHKHRKDFLAIHTTDKGKPHEIKIIVDVAWIIRDEDGEVIALEVVDEMGTGTMVEFKSSRT